MSGSPDYVVLCVLACLAKMSRRQVSAASLGGKSCLRRFLARCDSNRISHSAASLGGKSQRQVNAIAPASTWMVRYVISSTPFRWHVRCDCPALLSIVLHWHPLWFGKLPNLPAPFVLLHRSSLSRLVGLMAWRLNGLTVYVDRRSTEYCWLRG